MTAVDFDDARDRVLLGIERAVDGAARQEDLERTAYHEAGHALCAAVQENHDPVHKVTIIPTGMALGVTMTLPAEDRHTMDKTEAEARMVMAMGGRVAESLVFDEYSSGAANDLQQATDDRPPDGHRMGHERGRRTDVARPTAARSSSART